MKVVKSIARFNLAMLFILGVLLALPFVFIFGPERVRRWGERMIEKGTNV